MRHFRWLSLVLLLGAGAAAAGGAPRAVHASTQVPMSFTITAHDQLVPCATGLCFINAGSGNALHVGAFTVSGSAVVTGFFPSATQLVTTDIEQYVFTAANGDTINLVNYATGVEDLATGMVQITGTWQITGGTGRFIGATGQGVTTGTGLANNVTGTVDGTFTLAGSMSSVGSLR